FVLTIAKPRSNLPHHLSQRGSYGCAGVSPCCKLRTYERLFMLSSKIHAGNLSSGPIARRLRGRFVLEPGAGALFLVLLLLAVVNGCASGSHGLPPGLTIPQFGNL